MLDFFKEGGFGMFPVLILGLVMVGSSGKYTMKPDVHRLRFVIGMAVTLAATMFHASLMGLANVFHYLEDPQRAPEAEFSRILMVGLKECTRPTALGGSFLTLGLILMCVGLYRAGRQART